MTVIDEIKGYTMNIESLMIDMTDVRKLLSTNSGDAALL